MAKAKCRRDQKRTVAGQKKTDFIVNNHIGADSTRYKHDRITSVWEIACPEPIRADTADPAGQDHHEPDTAATEVHRGTQPERAESSSDNAGHGPARLRTRSKDCRPLHTTEPCISRCVTDLCSPRGIPHACLPGGIGVSLRAVRPLNGGPSEPDKTHCSNPPPPLLRSDRPAPLISLGTGVSRHTAL